MRRLILLAALLLPLAAHAQDGRARGPLGLRTQGPQRELFLDLTLFDARALEAPELDVRWAMANTWNQPMQLRRHEEYAVQELDEQADSLTLRLRAPWSRLLGPGPAGLPGSPRPLFARLSTAAEWRLTLHWGGWSDRPIEAWHALTGAFNYQRDHAPRDGIFLFQGDDRGVSFNLRGATLAPGDLVLRTALLLAEAGASPAGPSAWGVSLRLDLKLPTGSLERLGGSGGFDAGLALQASARLGPSVTLHGQAGLVRLGGWSSSAALAPKRLVGTLEASLEWEVGPVVLMVEDRVLSPLFLPGWDRTFFNSYDGALSSGLYATFRAHNQLSFALRWGRFALWLAEDFTPGENRNSVLPFLYVSNAPDVVLGLAYTQGL